MKERAAKLAHHHWGYAGKTISIVTPSQAAYTHAEMMAIAEHIYISTATHFHGHGVEDERNREAATPNPLPDPWDGKGVCGRCSVPCKRADPTRQKCVFKEDGGQ